MEEQADDWLSNYAASELGKGKDGGDNEPPPLRLWNPLSYVLQTWDAWHRHGILPKSGSFDDQDTAWVADMQTITARYNWHARQLMDEHAEGPRDLQIEDVLVDVGRTNWDTFIGD